MKKRLISLLLTLSMVFSMVPMLGIGVGASLNISEKDLANYGKDIFMAYYLAKDDADVNYYASNGAIMLLDQLKAAYNGDQYTKAVAYNFITFGIDDLVDVAKKELIEKRAYYATHFFNAWFSNLDGQIDTEIDAKDKEYEFKKLTLESVEDYTDFSGSYISFLETIGEDSELFEEIGLSFSVVKNVATVANDYNELNNMLAKFSSINGSERSFADVLNSLKLVKGLPRHADEAIQQILNSYNYTCDSFDETSLINGMKNNLTSSQILDATEFVVSGIFDKVDELLKLTESGPLQYVAAVTKAQKFGEFVNNNLWGTDAYVENLFNIINLGDIVLCLRAVVNYYKDQYIADPFNDEKARVLNTAYKMTLSFIYYTYDHLEAYVKSAYRADIGASLAKLFGSKEEEEFLEKLKTEKNDVGNVLFNYEKQISDRYRKAMDENILDCTKYFVRYNANKGKNAPASHENKGVLSTQVPTRTGYTFLGWDEDPTVQSPKYKYKTGETITISKTGDITLYAIWEAKAFNVIFDANGGKFADGSATASKQKVYNNDFVFDVTPPKRDGYNFLGWSLYNDDTVDWKYGEHENDIGDPSANDKRVYAVWEDTEAIFRYDYSNCADYEDIPVALVNGSASFQLIDPPDAIVKKIGKEFVKWMQIKVDGSKVYYNSGDTITITNDDCVYAVWETPSNTPILTVLPDKSVYEPGDTAKITITADNSGYFRVDASSNTGFKLSNAEGNKTSSGVFVEKTSSSTAEALKCYTNGKSYTVNLYIPSTCKDGSYNIKITASNGVYDKSSDSSVSGTETGTISETLSINVGTEEETVSTYLLSYSLNGGHGTIPESEEFEENSYVTLATDRKFSRDGYEFGGWSKEPDGSGKVYKAGGDYKFGESVLLYAIWEPIEGYGDLDLAVMVERYSKVYKPGETACVFVYPDYSNHFYFDVSGCSGFTLKNSVGVKATGCTWFEKSSPNYDSSKEGYTDGGMIPIYVYIPSNCSDGQYTFYVTASNGVLQENGTSAGDKFKQSVTIYVYESDAPESIAISKTEMVLHVGQDRDLDAVAEPQHIFNHYNKVDFTWKSSNTKVATVSRGGNVEAVKSGTAEITVTAEGVSASCYVTVKNCDYVVKEIDPEYLASEATCAEQATYYYLCSCGDVSSKETYKAGSLAAHTYSAWKTVTEAGEYNAGLRQRTCSGCGDIEQEAIPALGHTHKAGSEWFFDETDHWHICTGEQCKEILDKAAHTDTDKNGSCDTCRYAIEVPHEHEYGTKWQTDETSHWHECECGERAEENKHTDTDKNGSCDTCGHAMEVPHEHEYETKWQADETSH